MRKLALGMMAATLVVAGCGGVRTSPFNPFNWFGKSQRAAVYQTKEKTNPLIPKNNGLLKSNRDKVYAGTPIGIVRDVVVEPVPGGAILRAKGTADRLGPYEVRLTEVAGAPADKLIFTFDVVANGKYGPGGSERAREVTVARKLTHGDLVGIRSIQVQGARNARVASRR